MERILIIERRYGSVVAERAAERLGWKLWDRELTTEVARLARVDRTEREERVDSQMN